MRKPSKQARLIQALKDLIAATRKLAPDANTFLADLAVARQKAEDTLAEISPPPKVTVNEQQGLYVIPCGTGYTCMGFDYLLERYAAVAEWLTSEGLATPRPLPPEARGSIRAYTGYRMLMERAAAHCKHAGRRCTAELTPQLVGLEGRRVEVTDRHGDTRRFWVGKSMGWMPCHLEITRKGNTGGPAVCGAPFQSVRTIA